MSKKIRAAIVYHYVAHYRKPVFEALCGSNKTGSIEYSILASNESNVPSIKVLSPDNKSAGTLLSAAWRPLKNRWLGGPFLWQSGLIKAVLSKQYDVFILLGNMYYISTWFALVLAKLTGQKTLLWTHGVRMSEDGLVDKVRRRFYALSDGLLLYGHRAESILKNKGMAARRLNVIYNSLDFDAQQKALSAVTTEQRESMKSELGINPGDSVIVTIGRITVDKRFDLAVEALAELDKSGSKNTKLLVIGSGPAEASFKQKVDKLKLGERVIMYGPCYDEHTIACLISMCSAMVVPGDIGLSAIHSLTYGTPVITHNQFDTHKPEYEVIEDGVTGSFYQHGNIASLSSKIDYWSKIERQQAVKQCIEAVEKRYTPKVQRELIEQVIGKTVNDQRH